MWIWAAEGGPTPSPLDFLQYGALGLVIVALLVGWLWPRPSVDQIKADKASVEAQRDTLISAYETQIIPVLTSVQREFVPATASVIEALKELRSQISLLEQEITALKRQAERGP